MIDALLESALQLPKAQRILLVEQIWDSIALQQEDAKLTAAQQAELKRRIDRVRKTGPRGSDWATVKKRLMGRAKS